MKYIVEYHPNKNCISLHFDCDVPLALRGYMQVQSLESFTGQWKTLAAQIDEISGVHTFSIHKNSIQVSRDSELFDWQPIVASILNAMRLVMDLKGEWVLAGDHMSETQKHPTLAVVTVTSGRLLTRPKNGGNGIEDLYELLGWMTGDSPFTHQLGRFAEECKPYLKEWFPDLWAMNEYICQECDAGRVVGVCDEIESRCGVFLDVPKIPADDHDRIHPYDELVQMRGTDEGIIVIDEKGQVR